MVEIIFQSTNLNTKSCLKKGPTGSEFDRTKIKLSASFFAFFY